MVHHENTYSVPDITLSLRDLFPTSFLGGGYKVSLKEREGAKKLKMRSHLAAVDHMICPNLRSRGVANRGSVTIFGRSPADRPKFRSGHGGDRKVKNPKNAIFFDFLKSCPR